MNHNSLRYILPIYRRYQGNHTPSLRYGDFLKNSIGGHINEDISEERKDLIDRALELILSLWDDKLRFMGANIVPDVDIKRYHFYTKVSLNINREDWKWFRQFFDFLESNGMEFSFDGTRIDFLIEDINSLIDNLEELQMAKKYNL